MAREEMEGGGGRRKEREGRVGEGGVSRWMPRVVSRAHLASSRALDHRVSWCGGEARVHDRCWKGWVSSVEWAASDGGRGGGNDPEAKRRARTDHVENLTREGVADRSPPTEGKGPGWERELPGKLDSSRGRRGRNRRKERGSDEVGGG